MPRPSQKNKIMLAALSCFAEKGYDGARNKDIAKASGTSEAALYRHFESKEDLARSLHLHYMNMLVDKIEEAAASHLPTLEKLRDIVTLMLNSYRRETSAFRFVLINVDEYMWKLPRKTRYPVDAIETLIIEGQRSGVVRGGDARILASVFLGCILRPILASLAPPGFAPDLAKTREHDNTIVDAAIAAVSAATK
jgi:AcrR family transcriptional regulator